MMHSDIDFSPRLWYNVSMRILIVAISLTLVTCATFFETRDIEPELPKDTSSRKVVKIAIIDTGFDIKYKNKVKLCPTGHKSFTEKPWYVDSHGHGTHVAGLVAKYADTTPYCVIILKFYEAGQGTAEENGRASILAWDAAVQSDADMIMYSAGGGEVLDAEKILVEKALDAGKIVVAAAGNGHQEGNKFIGDNLDEKCNYFIACYDKRIVVVGNRNPDHTRYESSNYGNYVDFYAKGVDIKGINGKVMTGTSQANAIITGKLAREVYKEKTIKGYRSRFLTEAHGGTNDRH